jgi:hypothetical protein
MEITVKIDKKAMEAIDAMGEEEASAYIQDCMAYAADKVTLNILREQAGLGPLE